MLVKMDPGEFTLSQQMCCDGCRQSAPSYDIVHYGSIERGYRRLCGQCFNTEVAKAAGLEGFEHAKFEPVGLADCAGEVHEFHFRTHLFGPGVALRALSVKHLVDGELGLQIGDNRGGARSPGTNSAVC